MLKSIFEVVKPILILWIQFLMSGINAEYGDTILNLEIQSVELRMTLTGQSLDKNMRNYLLIVGTQCSFFRQRGCIIEARAVLEPQTVQN